MQGQCKGRERGGQFRVRSVVSTGNVLRRSMVPSTYLTSAYLNFSVSASGEKGGHLIPRHWRLHRLLFTAFKQSI